MYIVCPECLATNRVAETNLDKVLECGRCHCSLFNQHPLNANESIFQKQIQNNEIPVVVDFWAQWCGPCRMMAPEFEKACQMLEPNARFLKVDSDAEQKLSLQWNIRSIPTLLIFKSGKEVARLSGARSAAQLIDWVRPHL